MGMATALGYKFEDENGIELTRDSSSLVLRICDEDGVYSTERPVLRLERFRRGLGKEIGGMMGVSVVGGVLIPARAWSTVGLVNE